MKRRTAAVQKSGPRFRFITDIIAELKRVVWLSRREITYLTGIVLLVTALTGLILGVIDYGFSRLVNDIILGGG